MKYQIFLTFLLTIFSFSSASTISVTTDNGNLMLNGAPFHLKGLSWFGFEIESIYAVQGLDQVSLSSITSFLSSNGFNAVRLPWAPAILNPSTVPQYLINYGLNPSLQGLNSLQVLDAVIESLGNAGILVMLDMHLLDASQENNPPTKLWFDSTYTLDQMQAFWVQMVTHYQNTWNVFAADIYNEPHTVNWQTWAPVAERVANAILAVNPNLLIFVEGANVQNTATNAESWFGGAFEELSTYTINLSVPNKLVLSPHVYGPSVFVQPYFTAANFPDNMPAIWDADFGFIKEQGLGTIVIGEFGGYDDPGNQPTVVWLNAITQYFISKGITNSFFWDLAADSGGTGGVLLNDWVTPDNFKLGLLAQINPNPTVISNQGTTTVNPPSSPIPSSTPVVTNTPSSSPDVTMTPSVTSTPTQNSPTPSSSTCSCQCSNGAMCSGRTLSSPSMSPTSVSSPSPSPTPTGTVYSLYMQCGGKGGSCSTNCVDAPWGPCVSGSSCVRSNPFYYQCLPSK